MVGVDATNHYVHPALGIKLYGEPVQRRKRFLAIDGLVRADYGVYNSNVAAIVAALSERYFRCEVGGEFLPALPVEQGAYDECAYFSKSLVRRTRGYGLAARSRAAVVESYHGRKRLVYAEAARNLDVHRLDEERAHLLATFVKFEKMNTSKAPRIIQPRTPEYTLELARYIKHIEKPIFKAISQMFGGPTVIKGYNASKSAELMHEMWTSFESPVAVGLDATKFDMHVTRQALEFEHSVYNGIYGRAKLERLLKKQLHNSGIAYAQDGHVKFSIEGTRSSGDINTALGNCIIMCALVHTWLRRNGIKARLANNGDDCVVIMERSDLLKFSGGLEEWFESKGFRMKVEVPVDRFERIEFCQSHPVMCGDGWRMVRNVETCLHKDAMCLMPYTGEKDVRMWFGAVSECGLASYTGVPVLEAFYRMFGRVGVRPSRGYMARFQYGTGRSERAVNSVSRITDDARVSFYLAFGITPDVQMDMEWSFTQSVIDLHLYNQILFEHSEPLDVITNRLEYDEIETDEILA